MTCLNLVLRMDSPPQASSVVQFNLVVSFMRGRLVTTTLLSVRKAALGRECRGVTYGLVFRRESCDVKCVVYVCVCVCVLQSCHIGFTRGRTAEDACARPQCRCVRLRLSLVTWRCQDPGAKKVVIQSVGLWCRCAWDDAQADDGPGIWGLCWVLVTFCAVTVQEGQGSLHSSKSIKVHYVVKSMRTRHRYVIVGCKCAAASTHQGFRFTLWLKIDTIITSVP